MGNATIFAGSKIKALKSILNLNGGADVISSTTNPTAVAVSAEPGSLLLNTSSGKVYRKNDTGSSTNWTEVGSGGGGLNYITNPSADSSTTGWSTYADAAGAQPVDGTGGTANVTWTRSTTTPLRGSADFQFSKDAVNRQGQGVATDFVIDLADQATVLQVSFDYEVVSGTYADGDLTIYLIADPSGTPVVIQPAGFRIMSGTAGTKLKAKATFQTQATGTSYRLVFHVASTSALAYTLAIDNVVVGPQVTSIGPAVGDWQSFTPTVTNISIGNGSLVGRWRRVGDSAEIQINLDSGSTTGFTGVFSFGIPSSPSLIIDTTKLSATNQPVTLGIAQALDQGTAYFVGSVGYLNSTSVQITAQNGSVWSNTVPFIWNGPADDQLSLNFTVPIVGWSSNTVMSNDTDTRVVALAAIGSGNQSIANLTPTTIQFNTIRVDTHGSLNTSNYTYTVPVSGIYKIHGKLAFAANGTGIRYARAVISSVTQSYYSFPATAGDTNTVPFSYTARLNAGDTVIIQGNQSSGGALNALVNESFFNIERLSGPAQIAASETVGAFYSSSAGQSFTNNTLTTAIYATKSFDTHNAMNTTTGLYTAPVSGIYEVKSSAYFATAITATATDIQTIVRVDGASIAGTNMTKSGTSSTPLTAQGSFLVRVNAGQTIGIALLQANSALSSQSLLANATFNWISIMRVGN